MGTHWLVKGDPSRPREKIGGLPSDIKLLRDLPLGVWDVRVRACPPRKRRRPPKKEHPNKSPEFRAAASKFQKARLAGGEAWEAWLREQ